MLSNNTFLETRIQRLLDGLIFVEKGLGVHVQRMLKMSRGLYTGGNFKQNTWKKEEENWGPYLRSWFDILTIWSKLIFIRIYYAITACTTTTFTFGNCWLKEKWYTLKIRTFLNFLYTFSINCVATGARKMPIEYMFCFTCSEQCIKVFCRSKKCGLFSSVFKKIIPNNTSPTFQWVGGVT